MSCNVILHGGISGEVGQWIMDLDLSHRSGSKVARITYNRVDRYIKMLKEKGTKLSKINRDILAPIKGYEELWELRPDRWRIMVWEKSEYEIIILTYFMKKSKVEEQREYERAWRVVERLKGEKDV